MITFEECGRMLDEIADEMPTELFRELNAGISLVPKLKLHPAAVDNDLFILGEYIRNSLGNSIVFYFGSIRRVYGRLPQDEMYRELKKIMHHEVRHHNEYLAGCDDLGIWDKQQIEAYLKRKKRL